MACQWLGISSILLLTLCQASPIDEATLPDRVDLTSVRYLDKNNYQIYFEKGKYKGAVPGSYHMTVLIEDDKFDEHSDKGSVPSELKSENQITFEGDIKSCCSGKDKVDFDFVGSDDDEHLKPLIKAEPTWAKFPKFPKEFIVEYDAQQSILRTYQLEGSMTTIVTDMKKTDTVIPSVDDKALGYYVKVQSEDPKNVEFTPCSREPVKPKDGDELAVCDAPVKPTPKELTEMTVTEACLRYSHNEDGDVGSSFTLELSGVPHGTENLEIIFDYEKEESVDTVHKALLSGSLGLRKVLIPVPAYETNPSLDMTIVGILKDHMDSFAKLEFIDYRVVGYPISKTSLEVHWDYVKDMNAFHLSGLNVEDEDYQIHEAFVHCKGQAGDHCFGYFRDLEAEADYKITVKPDDKPQNMIESNLISLKFTPTLNIEYARLREINGDLVASLCFNHTDNTVERLSTHYDVVMIDHRGQWQKEKLVVSRVASGNSLCGGISGKVKNGVDVDKATILVIQRSQDGITPLATGEIQIQ